MSSVPATKLDPTDRPLRRDAERNRVRILQAAREVFAERGLSASLEDIAHHAGVGIGTVYRRYPDKRELIDALFEERIALVVGVLEEGLADPDPWSGFVRGLEGMLELQAADRGLMELMVGGVCAGDRTLRARGCIAPLALRLLQRAQEDGRVRPDLEHGDIPLLQLTLGSLVDATRDTHPDLWRRYFAVVLDGLRTQRRRPTPLPGLDLCVEQVEETMRGWRPPAKVRGDVAPS